MDREQNRRKERKKHIVQRAAHSTIKVTQIQYTCALWITAASLLQ